MLLGRKSRQLLQIFGLNSIRQQYLTLQRTEFNPNYRKENITTTDSRRLNLFHFCNRKMSNDISEQIIYSDIPVKSENDPKIYRTLTLPNGLRALLVSDPTPVVHDGDTSSTGSVDTCDDKTTSSSISQDDSWPSTSDSDAASDTSSEEGDEKLAACAVLLDVGSFSEPTEYQGLAHFLEHMIFMGSEKYPMENAFDAHIKKCGGFANANTECEDILFYFEVADQHLDSSMDYFSALLKAPLMKKDAMTREIMAVDSEFQQTLYDDEARRDQLIAGLASENYPHGTFTWGNLISLKEGKDDDDLHAKLHEFWQRHYSAHRMFICVQARLAICDLEELVIKHFAPIPKHDLPGFQFDKFNFKEAFKKDFHELVYFVKPVENICKLELTWVLPPMTKLYKSRPDQYLAYLMGFEGEGSLYAYLRRRLWAVDLISGIDDSGFDSNSMYALFNLCIVLTPDGFQNLDEVLAATFSYVKLLHICTYHKDMYAEIQKIEEINFRFQSQRPAFDNVQTLVHSLKYYPAKDILTGTDLYFEYNETVIREIIEYLNQFNFNIMITTDIDYENVKLDQTEKWFGTKYTTIEMPKKWIDIWECCNQTPELFLPKSNRFIANDSRLFWVENGKPEIPLLPKKILQSDIGELWFRQDDKFNLPEAFLYFHLISPLITQSPKNDAMSILYTQFVKFKLNEELYPATVAGLNYQFYSKEKGLIIKVNGLNAKLHLLVEIITKTMMSISDEITDKVLQAFIIQQKKSYFNELLKPRKISKDIVLSILDQKRWPIIEKYKVLSTITLEDIIDFSKNITNELYIKALMQGNLNEETAHNVMNSVLSTLKCSKIKDTKHIESRTIQLPQGSNYIRCNSLNSDDANSVICNFYQIGPSTIRIESIMDLLIMFVEEPLFDKLRTKEQLGYYVTSSVSVHNGIIGYSIIVNSQENKFTATHVEERIESFRGSIIPILESIDNEEFDLVRDSLIKLKLVVDTSLAEEVERNWGEIMTDNYIFDRIKREVDVLRILTKQEIMDFCLKNEKLNFRKLSAQVIGFDRVKPKSSEDSDPTTIDTESDATNEKNIKLDNKKVFNTIDNELDLLFLPKEDDPNTIVNIQDFKKNLYVYPVTTTQLESPIIEEEAKRLTPTIET